MTDNSLAKLYQDACTDDARLLADVAIEDLVDLAQGRLAGERRATLVAAIAASPSLAAAWRVARASGDWAQALADDMAGKSVDNVRALPVRRTAASPVRQRWALAAAVSAMAVGAVFVAQHLGGPSGADGSGHYATGHAPIEVDAILATSFDAGRHLQGEDDVIFTARLPMQARDSIFGEGFGNGT